MRTESMWYLCRLFPVALLKVGHLMKLLKWHKMLSLDLSVCWRREERMCQLIILALVLLLLVLFLQEFWHEPLASSKLQKSYFCSEASRFRSSQGRSLRRRKGRDIIYLCYAKIHLLRVNIIIYIIVV